MASSIGNKVNGDVDESLYSRQLYVFGHEAQRKLGSSSVLIMGLNGLGIETAKNIILAGVKSVTLYDNTLTSFEDLSAQFYLSELDIGKPRSLTSSKKLSELNPYVEVIALSEPITTDIVSHHTCVVLVDQPWEILSQISEFCHQKNIPVLTGDVRGVFGSIFCDFGKSFVVHDPTGEEAVTCVIENITQDYPAVVRVLEENRHNLESGDMVTLSGINGMGELNGGQYVVTVLDGYSFTINIDTRLFHPYHSGGYMTQVKQPVTLSFKPLLEAVNDPGMFNIDIMKFDSAPLLHLAWRTLHKYKESHAGQFPEPGNLTQAQEFFELAMHINNAALTQNIFHVDPKTVSDKATFLKRFALCCRGVISPLCALVGGILGQETLKACSGKFTPLQQFFYFDGIDALSDEPLPMEEVTPVGSRYDGQIMVFGKSIQQKLMSTNAFLVGAGAIGCEMLKNWAMMGISTGMNGRGATYVTDMDQIERSNLSRQFLFRNTNIGHLKSDTAVTAVKSMNPSFQAVAYDQKVGVETEAFFGDDFFDNLDIVCAALDNVDARLYLDQRCLLYHKPMFESGTLGAKGHTQVVLPRMTENYGASRDPPEKSIPLCTLKSFPNRIEHTLQWAREYFEEIYKQTPENVNRYIIDTNEFVSYLQSQSNAKLDILQKVKQALDQRPQSYADCLMWARLQFEDLYNNNIQQLLYNLPLDKMSADNTPFWSGAKMPPSAVRFDPADPLHQEYVTALADMRAHVYRVPTQTLSSIQLASVLTSVPIPAFKVNEGVKIALTEEEAKEEAKKGGTTGEYMDVDTVCNQILSGLPPAASFGTYRLAAVEFDKDIDSHMRVVCAASNLRARNYRIPEADLHRARGIAGKIIPAIATTTAMVTGIICLEIVKYIQNKPVSKFVNSFTNLALPFFTSAEPTPPKVTKTVVKEQDWKWTTWDRIDINQPTMTVSQLMAYVEEAYGTDLTMLSAGVSILYTAFGNAKKNTERKNMTLKAVYESITRKTIPESQKYMVFEIILSDMDSGDEIEVPYVRFHLR